MSEIRIDTEGVEIVRQRILAESSADVGRLEPTRTSIAITHGQRAVLLCTLDVGRGQWSVIHLWGPRAAWLRMLRRLTEELIARGHGATPVRWANLDDRPTLKRAVQRLNIRIVRLPSGKLAFEITANEALILLDGVTP